MHSKTLMLTTIRNELKHTISASGGLGLLQMVSEPNTKKYVGKDVGPQGG